MKNRFLCGRMGDGSQKLEPPTQNGRLNRPEHDSLLVPQDKCLLGVSVEPCPLSGKTENPISAAHIERSYYYQNQVQFNWSITFAQHHKRSITIKALQKNQL